MSNTMVIFVGIALLLSSLVSAAKVQARAAVFSSKPSKINIASEECLGQEVSGNCDSVILFSNFTTEPTANSKGPYANPRFQLFMSGFTKKAIDFMGFQNLRSYILLNSPNGPYFSNTEWNRHSTLSPGIFYFRGDFTKAYAEPNIVNKSVDIFLERIDGKTIKYSASLQQQLGEPSCLMKTIHSNKFGQDVDLYICTDISGSAMGFRAYLADTELNKTLDPGKCPSTIARIYDRGYIRTADGGDYMFLGPLYTPKIKLSEGKVISDKPGFFKDVFKIEYSYLDFESLNVMEGIAIFNENEVLPSDLNCSGAIDDGGSGD